ncbi:MAG: succinate dehydrogenase assembly factor 2 [Betaproteobacteria bacterium]|jgi:antitoxin CptB|nr:MAG: succinate dehydrogenase assembly factor 2 [Betaproteobacteria bacterium]
MSERDRIRWRCRRGLLELDLVLNEFLESRFEQLTTQQKVALTQLLDLSDNDLWDLVIGRAEIEDAGCAEIVTMLR